MPNRQRRTLPEPLWLKVFMLVGAIAFYVGLIGLLWTVTAPMTGFPVSNRSTWIGIFAGAVLLSAISAKLSRHKAHPWWHLLFFMIVLGGSTGALVFDRISETASTPGLWAAVLAGAGLGTLVTFVLYRLAERQNA